MNIALTAHSSDPDSALFYEFAQAPWLLIINIETMECTPIAHTVAADSDQELARTILRYNCEAVITGSLDEKAFDILADEGVTRYTASGMNCRQAIDSMQNRALQFIRNPEGSDSCSGHHHH